MANKKITRTLLRYLTEIVVIFVGITISFMFDGWRESRNDRKEQVEFLNSLLADLRFKRDEINYEAKTAQQFIDSADRVIAAYESHKLISGNLADYMVSSYNS